jgi:hypothetical protein
MKLATAPLNHSLQIPMHGIKWEKIICSTYLTWDVSWISKKKKKLEIFCSLERQQIQQHFLCVLSNRALATLQRRWSPNRGHNLWH